MKIINVRTVLFGIKNVIKHFSIGSTKIYSIENKCVWKIIHMKYIIDYRETQKLHVIVSIGLKKLCDVSAYPCIP